MTSVMRIVTLVVALAMVLGPKSARAQSPAAPVSQSDVIQYTIQKGDTLRLIATQYYSAPSAVGAIFTRNKKILEDAYEGVRRSDPKFDARLHPFTIDTIYLKTIIELPALLVSKGGHLYKRMDVPMTPTLAQQIADKGKIDLISLSKIADQFQDGLGIPRLPNASPPPLPLTGYKKVVASSRQDATVKRESRPMWHTSPSNDIQVCAVAVCEKYRSLCYFECMAIAIRFDDSDVLCTNLPKTLPYEIDLENKDRCFIGAP